MNTNLVINDEIKEQNYLKVVLHNTLPETLIRSKIAIKLETLDEDYSFDTIDKIIEAINTKNAKLIEFISLKYLIYLGSEENHFESSKIYIMNTIFTIHRELHRDIFRNNLELLDCNRFIQYISQSESSEEILKLTEVFFNRLSILVSTNLTSPHSCSDIIQYYIDKNYQNHISLSLLTDIFHYCPSYISKTFHQVKGITISNYLKYKRIEHAIYLLQNSNILIKEISVDCGFLNITHFNRVFKELTNISPSQLRNFEMENKVNKF